MKHSKSFYKVLGVLFFSADFFSCSDDAYETVVFPPEFILADQDTGVGICYHDLVPDTTFIFHYPSSGMSFTIDLDGDGAGDFKYSMGQSASPGHFSKSSYIEPLGNAGIATVSGHPAWAVLFNFHDTICEDLNWSDSLGILHSYYAFMGSPAQQAGE